MARSSISAIVVCFNEEKNIDRCLNSLKWCDEIVVVDSYSTDRTLEICRRFTSIVIQRKWTGYRDQKEFAHSQATKDWVLLVDSDEEVSSELQEEIKTILTLRDKDCSGYLLPRLVYYLGRWWWRGGWYPDYDVRFFRHDRATWGGSDPHEKILVDGPVRRLRHPLAHYSYSGHRRSYAAHQPLHLDLVAASLQDKPGWRLRDASDPAGLAIFPFVFFEARIHGRLCRFLRRCHGRRLCFSQIC